MINAKEKNVDQNLTKEIDVNNSEPAVSIIDKAENLFNFLINTSYKKDLQIYKDHGGFNQSITCCVYFLSEDKKFSPELDELSYLLNEFNVYLEFSQNFDNEMHFLEQFNNSHGKTILIVNECLTQHSCDHLIWRKIKAGDVVPYITQPGLEKKLPAIFDAIRPIDGTSSCPYKKVWNVICCLYRNNDQFKKVRSKFTHSKEIKKYQDFLSDQSNILVVESLIEKHKEAKMAQSKKLEDELLTEIAGILQKANKSESDNSLTVGSISPLKKSLSSQFSVENYQIQDKSRIEPTFMQISQENFSIPQNQNNQAP